MFTKPRAHGLGHGGTTECVLSGEPRSLEPLLQQRERPGSGLEFGLAFGDRPRPATKKPSRFWRSFSFASRTR